MSFMRKTSLLLRSFLLLYLFQCGHVCFAQSSNDFDQRLYEKLPYYRLTLTAQYNNDSYDILPISFPGGKKPNPLPKSGDVTIQFAGESKNEYKTRWDYIAEIKTFNELIFDELLERLNRTSEEVRNQTPNAGQWKSLGSQFDALYDYFLVLEDVKSELPRLSENYDRFLYEEAVYRVKSGDHLTGLSRLETLYERNKNYPDLIRAWGFAVNYLLETEVSKKQYETGYRYFKRLKKAAPDNEFVVKWEKTFNDLLREVLDQSRQACEKNDWVSAYRLADEAKRIMDDSTEQQSWEKELRRKVPRIDVAVNVPVPKTLAGSSATSLLGRGTLRAERLLQKNLCDYFAPSLAGGVYHSSVGTLEKVAGGNSVKLIINDDDRISAATIAGQLFALSEPENAHPLQFFFQRKLLGIEPVSARQVNVHFRQSLLVPDALLTIPVDRGTFVREPENAEDSQNPSVGFMRLSESENSPKVIFERYLPRSEELKERLAEKKIDIIDRVSPWDVAALRQNPLFQVGTYTIPSFHFLVPNHQRSYPANRTFRRALLYGLNRDRMLSFLLNPDDAMGQVGRSARLGSNVTNTEDRTSVVSGPFVKGSSMSDPLGYGYDQTISPRPYEPRLAMALSLLAANQIFPDEATPKPAIVIARPKDEMSVLVGMMIQRQCKAIGVDVSLVDYTEDDIIGESDAIDFWYVVRTVREPLIDAVKLFGNGGIVGKPSPYMALELDKLERCEDWPGAAKQLQAIHRLCFDETTVLPLWQLTEHYAYRKGITGIEDGTVQLYQNVERWQIAND